MRETKARTGNFSHDAAMARNIVGLPRQAQWLGKKRISSATCIETVQDLTGRQAYTLNSSHREEALAMQLGAAEER